MKSKPSSRLTIRVLSSLKTSPSGRQPLRQASLDLLGLLPVLAQGDQVVGVSDHNRGIPPQPAGMSAFPS